LKRISLGAGAVLILTMPVSAPAQSQIADTTRAFITVETRQPGLPVFVDEKPAGQTPLQNFAVTAGEHVIAVRRNFSASWLESDWSERVQATAGDTITLTPKFWLGYSINSEPAGAQVWLEGNWEGTTPYVLRLPDDMRAQVRLVLHNYQSAGFEIIPANTGGENLPQRQFNITLAPVPSPLISLTYDHEGDASRHRQRKWAMIAGGLSLVAGVGAVFLKQEADDAYAAYVVTGASAAREQYYDRAQKYDRYFGAAFGVSQVSFVFSVYSFLKSIR